MEWFLYILVFIFGYCTCRTFYFLRASRLSLSLVKCAELISLAMLAKSVEGYEFSRNRALKKLIDNGHSDSKIKNQKIASENEILKYKEASVISLTQCYNEFFINFCKFEDWASAMKYLEENRYFAQAFLNKTKEHND